MFQGPYVVAMKWTGSNQVGLGLVRKIGYLPPLYLGPPSARYVHPVDFAMRKALFWAKAIATTASAARRLSVQ